MADKTLKSLHGFEIEDNFSRKELSVIQDDVRMNEVEKLDITDEFTFIKDYYLHNGSGNPVTASGYTLSELYPVSSGEVYYITGFAEYSTAIVAFYDANKNKISTDGIKITWNDQKITIDEQTHYIRVGSKPAKLANIVKKEVSKPINEVVEKISTEMKNVFPSKNNGSINLWEGEFIGGYISSDKVIEHANYAHTKPQLFKPGIYLVYVAPGMGTNKNVYYTKNDTDSDTTFVRHATTELDADKRIYSFTLNSQKYMSFNLQTNRIDNYFMVIEGSTLDDYPTTWQKPYQEWEIIKEGVQFNETMTNEVVEMNAKLKEEILSGISKENNPLAGKVWYVLGDSATHGDFSSITQENLQDGLYKGELPVYPFFIGNRTRMIVHNQAQNGGTLAETGQSGRFALSRDGQYDALVQSDADYITIWLGANDMWQSVPVGTIDDTDNTTFYGAYNKVLTYYINNFPKAKIGIVASFWCTQEYAEAVIAIGKKYGVPCLNLYNDPNIPVTVGSKRPDVDSTIKNKRNSQWVVSSTNSHPSAEYHEIESWFIEHWLRSL